MARLLAHGLVALILLPAALGAQGPCAARPFSVPGTKLELRPLAGFVEVCGQDAALCRRLTAGYPAGTTTFGYFVPQQEWQAYQRGTAQGFSQYLIAQGAGSMSPSDLPRFKRHLHAKQGDIPDHTRLPALLESGGRVPIGVFDESESSISFGVVMSGQQVGSSESKAIHLVATNSMLVLGPQVLSLYVYRRFGTASDVDRAKEQTKLWLGCLRKAN
jgi:hypothetical protein